jgi:HK97 family phage prohead protease
MTTRSEAALARSQASLQPADRPSKRRMADADDAPRGVRATAGIRTQSTEERAASDLPADPHVVGVASVTEIPYEMYDMFGPYSETVAADAFDKTLAASPLVEFTRNHAAGGGLPMAHTRNNTLSLSVTDAGLEYDASVDGTRTDVSDMLKALKRGDLAEASFKFRIVRGQWSPDWTEYRILEADLDRGDVSAVNFGANPNATSALRTAPEVPAKRSKSEVLPDSAVQHLDIDRYL